MTVACHAHTYHVSGAVDRWPKPVHKLQREFGKSNCNAAFGDKIAVWLSQLMTVWPSGLRRWLQAPVRKGVGSNPTAVIDLGITATACAAIEPRIKRNYFPDRGAKRMHDTCGVRTSTGTPHRLRRPVP